MKPGAAATDIQLRPFTAADLPDVLAIEGRVFSTPWRENSFLELMSRDTTDLVAAEVAGALAGYIVCWTVADEAELGNLAVAPQWRGAGIARALIMHARERVRARGATQWFLEVRESNHAARKLYQSVGFEPVGRRRAYYAHPTEDALVLRLNLSSSA